MAQKQNAVADPTVRMDSRKFLGALNDSAQAKVAFFEDKIQKMGNRDGKNWRLVALHAKNLYFEDVDSNKYYLADHTKNGRTINISNIRPVQIVEEKKQDLFSESCLRLVDSIESNDQSGMSTAFKRMQAQRFSGRAVPHSGYVKCRDNVRRQITVTNEDVTLTDDVRNRLISAIVEGLSDRVIVENGQVVSGTFDDGGKIRLPVTKWSSRKLVAKRMRDAAADAYWSEGFQARVAHLAHLISEDKIEEAVNSIAPFLDEMEEFTLLDSAKTRRLVENALAANAIFNQTLCDDTATLFHRTNLKVNKNKIVAEWKNIAKKSEHPVLAENVQVLSESKNFEAAYDKFLHLIFEAISNREVAAEALATTLAALKTKTPRIRESHDLSSKLNNLIARLKQKDFDDAAIYEAEDLIATIQEELTANETLGDFDQLPGDDPMDDIQGLGGDMEGAPVININSPLIQVGGSSSAGGADELGGSEDLGMDMASEEGAEEGELADLLGDEDELGGGDEEDDLADLLGGMEESRKSRRSIAESRPNHYEMKKDDDDDHASGTDDGREGEEFDFAESSDPYAIKTSEFKIAESRSLNDYGAPVINDHSDLRKIVNIMQRLVQEYKMTESAIQENKSKLARASIDAIGLMIPAGKMPFAIQQVVNLFESEKPFPGAAEPFGKDDSDSDDSDSDDSGWEKPWEDGDDGSTAEDQLHGPRIPGRGLARDSYAPRSMKRESKFARRAITEGIKILETQSDAALCEFAGVKFIFDHGGNSDLDPVVLSEDGAVEIPIPEHLYASAFNSVNGKGGTDFSEWLYGSIEQLRPISDAEDRALEEAMATITTGPNGELQVNVSDDVAITGGSDEEMIPEVGDEELPPEMGDMGGPEDMEGMEDMEDMEDMEEPDVDMAPVDSLDMGNEEDMEDEPVMGDEGMPDFEAEESEMDSEDEEDEEEPKFEDKDITDPTNTKYTKHVKDNKRDMPAHKPTKKTDDKLAEVGPDMKEDDGSGTKPPTARKMSHK
jgi:hypothetical protein